MAKKLVYLFGGRGTKAEGNAEMKDILGGKGANLAEMTNLGIPVPPGFTISTEMCRIYYETNGLPKELKTQVKEAIRKVERIMELGYGDVEAPLLFSVRSGAKASMPGMMDTVLNLGLNDATVHGLVKMSGNERFAYDCYRRFIQMYSDVVMGADSDALEEELEKMKHKKGVRLDTELTADDLKKLVAVLKEKVKKLTGKDLPSDPMDQLWGGIEAVFKSWNTPRAITYRKLNSIPDEWGTAVNVQAMVFGNMGENSATGVAFTRDPATGENVFYGEYLQNAQGEDVVAGIRTPMPINIKGKRDASFLSMQEALPDQYNQLEEIYLTLERHYRDMQDIEFTIQEGNLWMLQTRTGKRTAAAAVNIAVDMVKEGLITREEAVSRVNPDQIDQLLHPQIDPKAEKNVIGKGLPASPGAAVGKVVFSAEDAEVEAARGEKVILVRIETSPEDIHGMNVAQGILTARGGMTSHAAVVARGMGKCCVSGCQDLVIDYKKQVARLGAAAFKKGDYISLNGTTGEVMLGEVATVEPSLSGAFGTLMKWADKIRKLGVRTNADTPKDSRVARDFGAEGIGLCRTEHMFFDADRILAVREMILSDDEQGRRKALEKIKPMQKGDFEAIFEVMDGLPVTIRLLDPPLHEFLPNTDAEVAEVAKALKKTPAYIEAKRDSLHESNPMLGHRGCRLGITFPEIYEMQVRAIMEAACGAAKKGVKVKPEIMIPLVAHVNELAALKAMAVEVAEEVMKASKIKLDYLVGTMIELPRAALTADEIARQAEFFSFGTNDLTQTTFGLSRDDAGKFLPFYVDKKIFPKDPFTAIDQDGLGELIKIGVKKGRSARRNLKIGICGEHGGEPSSIEFCHRAGFNYVSCSPYRVPIARLAAAHAALKNKK
ncbi:MAG: pyruvate, phosphate dikinase [Deltaproteobacteria bacterium]|jgi:pyruvate,orthophosphate dikinase|nr:pyruvate, phosphate dikinase [Deltaproteobacteria bacterium]MDX9761349.1 pyruvate, phosphate dikinase [Desulfomonilia bacterium]HPW69206.1 pyruvate, phosphate dikinase [Deltaproteobacteria bacterium]